MQAAYLPAAAFPGIIGDGILKEGLDAAVNLAEVLIAASKLDGVPVDAEVAVAVDDLAVVDLVGVVGLGEDVLHHRPRVDDALPHPVVLQRNQVVVLVVEAGGVQVVERLVQPLHLARFATAF
jgi:hypothetical protein